jgi:hypothetical protein
MRDWILTAEAEECRLLAAELSDKPEAPFLLRLASAFEDLHVGKVNPAVFEKANLRSLF